MDDVAEEAVAQDATVAEDLSRRLVITDGVGLFVQVMKNTKPFFPQGRKAGH